MALPISCLARIRQAEPSPKNAARPCPRNGCSNRRLDGLPIGRTRRHVLYVNGPLDHRTTNRTTPVACLQRLPWPTSICLQRQDAAERQWATAGCLADLPLRRLRGHLEPPDFRANERSECRSRYAPRASEQRPCLDPSRGIRCGRPSPEHRPHRGVSRMPRAPPRASETVRRLQPPRDRPCRGDGYEHAGRPPAGSRTRRFACEACPARRDGSTDPATGDAKEPATIDQGWHAHHA